MQNCIYSGNTFSTDFIREISLCCTIACGMCVGSAYGFCFYNKFGAEFEISAFRFSPLSRYFSQLLFTTLFLIQLWDRRTSFLYGVMFVKAFLYSLSSELMFCLLGSAGLIGYLFLMLWDSILICFYFVLTQLYLSHLVSFSRQSVFGLLMFSSVYIAAGNAFISPFYFKLVNLL